MRKRNAWFLIAIIGILVLYYAKANSYLDPGAFNIYNEAMGHLAIAESAQTPNEIIDHVTIAKRLLPESGNISWWSPDKGDFKTIQAELDEIIIRADNISSLDAEDELYNSELLDMHARLESIQGTLV